MVTIANFRFTRSAFRPKYKAAGIPGPMRILIPGASANMSTKSRSANGRARRGRERPPAAAWAETEDDGLVPEPMAPVRQAAVDRDELRQLVARRRLEQYMESKRLREHLQEVFFDDER